jgi:hypothetical protein
MLFARDVPGALGMLLKQLDETIAQNKAADLRSFAVFPTADRKGMEAKLKELAQRSKISDNVPLVIPEDPATLKPYKIHPDAELTVILFKKWKVVGNFAFKAGEFKEADVPAIVAALTKIIPTQEELEQEAKEEREAKEKRDAELKKKLEDAKKAQKK